MAAAPTGPVQLLALASTAPDTPARERLTIVFSDLCESTALSTALEAEDYARLLGDVRRLFAEVIVQHHGQVNQYQGDGLQAIFGHPTASEDDSVHAAEAALAFHQRVRQLHGGVAALGTPAVAVHTGVHGGLMLTRQGDAVAGRLELFGAVPALAKHLSDLATADEILISDETLGPAHWLFETEASRRIVPKGRSEPMAISRVVARTALRTRFDAHRRRGLGSFIGRAAERQRLESALETVRHGRSQVVAVVGPAGIGKTRLAEDFLDAAASRGCRVLRSVCEPALTAEPLHPFRQMLRTQAGLLPGMPRDAARAQLSQTVHSLGLALPPSHHEALEHWLIGPGTRAPDAMNDTHHPSADLRDAVERWFAALSGAAPLIVFIDDWHAVDFASRVMAAALFDSPAIGLLGVLAMRPHAHEVAPAGAVAIMSLPPLSEAETDAAIEQHLPGADPFTVRQVRERAGGNPLYIEELCHGLCGADGTPGPPDAAIGTTWLDALIGARVARLPPAHAEVLAAAAVVGDTVAAWLLTALTGYAESDPVFDALEQADLLHRAPGGAGFRFKHGITREAVYGGIGQQRRRELHQQVVERLAGRREATPATLAYHLSGAGDDAAAAPLWEAAAMASARASAIDLAKAQFRAALQALDRAAPPEQHYPAWRAIVRRLGMACVFDPSRDDAAIFTEAVRRARAFDDAPGVGYAEYWSALVSYAMGEAQRAVGHGERAMQAAEAAGDAWLIALARGMLGQAEAAVGNYERAVPWLEASVAALRADHDPLRAGAALTYGLACQASVLGDLGRFEDAQAAFDEALRSLPHAGHEVEGSVRCWRSAVLLWQGRWAEALDDARAAEAIARRVRSLYIFGMARGLAAFARWRLQRADSAPAQLAHASRWLSSRDKCLFISLIDGWLAQVCVEQSQDLEAREHAARALRRARQGDRLGAAMACRATAIARARAGDAPAAWRRLAWAERFAQDRRSAHEAASNRLAGSEIERLLADAPCVVRARAPADPGAFPRGGPWPDDE